MRANAKAWVASAVLSLVLGGCKSVTLQPVEDGAPGLRHKDGYLVLHTTSNARFEQVALGDLTRIAEIPIGTDVRVVAAPAGHYSWSALRAQNLEWELEEDDATMDFEVRAGRLNYPGELVVQRRGLYARVRTRNRSASVLPLLARDFPRLLRRYPLVYTGFQRDDFFDFYNRVNRSMRPPRIRSSQEAALDAL